MSSKSGAANGGFLDRTFHLSQKHTSVKQETIAGLTTFLTMVYIVAVNPAILSATGMDPNALFWSTTISSALSCFAIAFYGNFPFALAPSMGLNAYFAYTVCGNMGLSWQQGLFCVLCSGLLFVVLGFFKVQQKIVDDLPDVIKHSVGAGVGFFVALCGMESGKMIVPDASTGVALGDLSNPGVLLCFLGVILTVVLVLLKVRGGILISILAITVIGIFVVDPVATEAAGETVHYTTLPDSLLSFENPIKALGPTLCKLSPAGLFDGSIADILGVIFVMISFFFVDLFGSVGVLLGLADAADLLDDEGKLPGAGKALFISAAGAAVGAVLGTSTVTIYGAESSTGIAEGGRTGLTAFVVGLGFVVCLFFAPIFLMIPSCATAPALIMVGTFMIEPLCHLDLGDLTVAFPAFVTVAMMPFTYNLAYGILFGLLAYILATIAAKKVKEITPTTWVLGGLFLLYFIMDIFL